MTTISAPTHRPEGVGSPFARAFRSDFISATTIRSNTIMAGILVAVSFGASFLFARTNDAEMTVVADSYILAGSLLAILLALVAGVLSFTTDLQHGSVRSGLIAQPSRPVAAASKAMIAALVGGVFGLITMFAGGAGALVNGVAMSEVIDGFPTASWLIPVTALAALAGVGFAMAGRSTALSITVLLAWWLIIESSLAAGIGESAKYLPFTTAFNVVHNDVELGRPQGLLLFAAFALALLAIGVIVFNRRDVD